MPTRSTVAEAIELLGHGHVSAGGPVVEGDHLVGVVTMSDLRRWNAARQADELDPAARLR